MTKDQFITLLISQAVIWLPMLLGNRLRRMGRVSERVAKPLYSVNLVLIAPVVFGLGVWRLDRSSSDWYVAPLLMAGFLLLSVAISLVVSPRLSRRGPSIGTFLLMIPLGNIGQSMAGFLTLLLLPPAAYPYNAVLMCPAMLFIFTICVPLATHWGGAAQGMTLWQNYRQVIFSPIVMPAVGLLIGGALNFAGLPMSDHAFSALKVLVFISTVSSTFAMGIRMRFQRVVHFSHVLTPVHVIKFLIHPLIMLALCLVFHVSGMAAGVLFIASCMPCAIMVVVLSTIYDLDVDLANAGFIWSTLIFMVVVLPLMILALRLPLFQAM